ncbi:hypothetical protein [Kutzneria buriramensis]|uniref:Uncharacterized protein n=1 Tax=Kutzneria buriramensis TaxID=1045776 RepID=A0A3E0HL59_9PSEU|nr:hypothetical protein [Kutzneria buriramensis]REH47080.1 hypothetical protein BCF44_106245 [Kutzneria buriramensis]
MNPNDPDRVWSSLTLDVKEKALSFLSTQDLAQVTQVDQATHALVGTNPVAGEAWVLEMSRHNDAYSAAVDLAAADFGAQWRVTSQLSELVRIIRTVPEMVTGLSADWSSHQNLLDQYNRFEAITERARLVMPEGVIPADPFAEITF